MKTLHSMTVTNHTVTVEARNDTIVENDEILIISLSLNESDVMPVTVDIFMSKCIS